MTICKHLATATEHRSPLGRMLLVGFYDGPTEGVVECHICRQAYGFRMVDWDPQQDVRVYAVVPLKERFDEIRDAFSVLRGKNRQTLILPPAESVEQFGIEELLQRIPELIVAASDLRQGIIARKAWSDGCASTDDWFAWLGL